MGSATCLPTPASGSSSRYLFADKSKFPAITYAQLQFTKAEAAFRSGDRATALIAYTFFGFDRLSEELEDPFGTEANDLALDSLRRSCEISVFEALGEPAPDPLAPRGYYLS